jgi:hypothetical protein
MRLKGAIKFIQALLAAVAAGILTAAQLDLPSEAFWSERKDFLFWTVLLSVAAAGLLALGEALEEHFGTKGPAVALGATRQLIATLSLVLEREGLQYDQVGLHVFLKGWALDGWKPRRIQRRIARLRLAGAPDDRGVLFTKGKGVIGQCWDSKAPARGDWSETWKKYRHLTKADWEQLEPHESLRFTYEEFQLTGPEYGAIVAYPIMDSREKYYGCVAIDGPPGNMALLWNDRVRGRLDICAAGILVVLKPAAKL